MNASAPARTHVARVLVVEDEDAIATPLAEGLARVGFDVTVARNGSEALAHYEDADVVLLDLGLPDIDGAEVCRKIRASAEHVAILVLTARGAELDRVRLLELGADDYLVKPFGFRELVARIRAIRRRAVAAKTAAENRESAPQFVGRMMIDRRARRVIIEDRELVLTPKEFDLLERLARTPGSVVPREHIIEDVWDVHWWGSTKTLDVHIATLRKKLGDRRWISTVRRVGYRLEEL